MSEHALTEHFFSTLTWPGANSIPSTSEHARFAEFTKVSSLISVEL